VITNGCHLKACQQLCRENGFKHIAGAFWGILVTPSVSKNEFNLDQFLKRLPKPGSGRSKRRVPMEMGA
jgi:hypothetical protein